MSEERKHKVILLEDEETLGRLYHKTMMAAGFDVKLYTDTTKLLKDLSKFVPDIAFLDHALHGESKSGLEVIPELRKRNPKMKIVILSNYSEFQMEQAAKKAGADDYLLKINTPPPALAKYAEKLAR